MSLRARLLVVEDDVQVRRILARGLEAAGFALDAASTGDEALRLAFAYALAAVLNDLSGRRPGPLFRATAGLPSAGAGISGRGLTMKGCVGFPTALWIGLGLGLGMLGIAWADVKPSQAAERETAQIRCYSGGKVIYEGSTTAELTAVYHRDGWHFREAASGKLMSVSGDCVIRYE